MSGTRFDFLICPGCCSRTSSTKRVLGGRRPLLLRASVQDLSSGSARLGGERVTFCFGRKSPKTIAPAAVISTTSCCLDCPCRLPIARRRELLHPCSRTCAPCSRDRQRGCGTADGAFVALLPAIHGLVRSKHQQVAPPLGARRTRADRGPSNTASVRRTSPKDGALDVRQFDAGTWMCRRRTPADANRPAAHGWAKGVFAGWPSLW